MTCVASHHYLALLHVAFETSISNVAIEDIPAILVLDVRMLHACKSDSSLVNLATSKNGFIKVTKWINLAKSDDDDFSSHIM